MPYNLPSYDTNRFSFGPGVLKLGTTGTTPTTDVGAVQSGATLTLTRELLEVPQGSPKTVVKRWATAESVALAVTGIEWNLAHLSEFLGIDYTAGPSPDRMDFGGALTVKQVSLKFIHQTPAGGTVEIWLWEATGAGNIEVKFGDDVHEFPYVFNAVYSANGWDGVTLIDGQNLCRIDHWDIV